MLLRVSDVKLVRPLKSPDFNVVRAASLVTDRVVIPARSAVVTAPQADLPATAATIASRTCGVRMQVSVTGTFTDTPPALTLP